jgi:hypothetical protein
MLDNIQDFIGRTAHFLALRDKEAGLGSVGEQAVKKVTKGLPGNGSVSSSGTIGSLPNVVNKLDMIADSLKNMRGNDRSALNTTRKAAKQKDIARKKARQAKTDVQDDPLSMSLEDEVASLHQIIDRAVKPSSPKPLKSVDSQIHKSIDEKKFAKPEPQGYTPSPDADWMAAQREAQKKQAIQDTLAAQRKAQKQQSMKDTFDAPTNNYDDWTAAKIKSQKKQAIKDTLFARKHTYRRDLEKRSLKPGAMGKLRKELATKYPELSSRDIDALTAKHGGPGKIMEFIRNNPKKSALAGVGTVGGGGVIAALPETPGQDTIQGTGESTPESRKTLIQDMESTFETPSEKKGPKKELSEKKGPKKELSEKGSNMLTTIQNFANTSTGAATIGGTTGAGLAYLADRLLTKDDEEEDTKGRRLLMTLLGGALGAGAGYAIQKSASDGDDVRALIRQDAAELSDEELESKISNLESLEKQASAQSWILDRLKLHCKVA